MNQFNKTTIIIFLLLIVSNIVWGMNYLSQTRELSKAQVELTVVAQNKKILAFQKMFIDKVLLENGNVDFNTRVELQNAANAINDDSLTQTWNAFLAAKTESEGQMRVKELLSLLASKVIK